MKVDIAVDPLEGTNLCATGAAGAITVLAASEHGGLLHAPDCYMEKIIVGPAAKGAVDLDAPVRHNLKSIARRLQRGVDDLVIVVLDRPRHQQLIDGHPRGGRAHPADRRRRPFGGNRGGGFGDRRACGDGVGRSAGGSADGRGAAVPEWRDPGTAGRERRTRRRSGCRRWGSTTHRKVYTTKELAPGQNRAFAACGVTDGNLLKGVRFFGDGIRTQSIVMTLNPARVRFIDTVHLENRPDVKVRFR